MKLLNLCAGANRPQSWPWINLDHLFPVLAEGTPERNNLLQEKNYVEFDVLSGPFPFEDNTFSGILASHCAEHWDCQQAVQVMKECRRVLHPGGVLLISVPDASYFRKVQTDDTPENSVQLFGESIHLPDGEDTFFGYGLWNRFHKTILTEDALWAYFVRSGFAEPELIHAEKAGDEVAIDYYADSAQTMQLVLALASILNRLPFSLIMVGVKE